MKSKVIASTIIGLYILNCVFSLLTSVFSPVAWAIVSALALGLMLWVNYRRSAKTALDACRVRRSLEQTARCAPERLDDVDESIKDYAWSRRNGFRAALICALAVYAINCGYIILTLSGVRDGVFAGILRAIAMFLILPFRAPLNLWVSAGQELNAARVLLLMLSPFVYPAVGYAGYLRGPVLWGRLEQTIRDRRASRGQGLGR